ncbi:MAG: FAD-dependent oxidoreductase [Rikenellaceae bacterium]
MEKRVIIIGGGVAGMSAAITLKKLGCDPLLIERSSVLGGVLNNFSKTLSGNRDTEHIIEDFSNEITKNDVTVVLCTEVIDIKKKESSKIEVICSCGSKYEGDALVIATGMEWHSPHDATEFGFGVVNNVLTLSEIEERLRDGEVFTVNQQEVKDVAIVHCVCSQNVKYGAKFCSKMCCTAALKVATELKQLLGVNSNVYEFYTDLKVVGCEGNELLDRAKSVGVELIRGGVSEIKPLKDKIELWAEDMVLQKNLRLSVDMVVLVMGVKGHKKNIKFGESLGLKTNNYAYFVKSEGEINSVKTAHKNIFTIGCSNSPKDIEESIHDGESAAVAIFGYFNDRRIKK